jgi:uncharacterized membrane protein YhaH (DUF805 family)
MDWIRFLFLLEALVSRRSYLLRFFTPLLLIGVVVGALVPPLDFNAAMVPLLLASVWPSIAVGAKRRHDRDRSGWFQLIALVRFIGWPWLMVELCCLGGTDGQNRFGTGELAAADRVLDCTTGNPRMVAMCKLPVVPLCRSWRDFCYSENILTPTPNQKHDPRRPASS